MGKTPIEWTQGEDGSQGYTWNPLRARNLETGRIGWHCEHASEGCRHCYAEQRNKGFFQFGTRLPYTRQSRDEVEIFLDENTIEQPLHWRKSGMIFVCSMTDLFGEFHKDEWIDRIFGVMALCPQHTFQVLTKRADRMRDWSYRMCRTGVLKLDTPYKDIRIPESWPLANCWMGVSVEDQKTADERIPLLLETPAAVRFISAEPLLGPIDLDGIEINERENIDALRGVHRFFPDDTGYFEHDSIEGIDWVIVGGESGPGARPMHPDWARSLRDQCVAAGTPFFMKQWGEFLPVIQTAFDHDKGETIHYVATALDTPPPARRSAFHDFPDGQRMIRVGKKAAGRLLDGREWNEFPSNGD
jgi:protein gp37